MNTTFIDFESFVENDNSPFIFFSDKGQILYLNGIAEILFGYVSKKELFDIAISYAPQNFGYKTTSISLNYDSFSFYAVTVGYQTEDQISLRLYSAPFLKTNKNFALSKLIETDINIVLEANISLFKIKNSNKLTLFADQDLPLCKLDQNNFSKLIRKVLESFNSSDSINISLNIIIGQHIIINNKKSAIAQIHISANGRYINHDTDIEKLAQNGQIKPILQEKSIRLDIPLIVN